MNLLIGRGLGKHDPPFIEQLRNANGVNRPTKLPELKKNLGPKCQLCDYIGGTAVLLTAVSRLAEPLNLVHAPTLNFFVSRSAETEVARHGRREDPPGRIRLAVGEMVPINVVRPQLNNGHPRPYGRLARYVFASDQDESARRFRRA